MISDQISGQSFIPKPDFLLNQIWKTPTTTNISHTHSVAVLFWSVYLHVVISQRCEIVWNVADGSFYLLRPYGMICLWINNLNKYCYQLSVPSHCWAASLTSVQISHRCNSCWLTVQLSGFEPQGQPGFLRALWSRSCRLDVYIYIEIPQGVD